MTMHAGVGFEAFLVEVPRLAATSIDENIIWDLPTVLTSVTTAERMEDLPHSAITVAFLGPVGRRRWSPCLKATHVVDAMRARCMSSPSSNTPQPLAQYIATYAFFKFKDKLSKGEDDS